MILDQKFCGILNERMGTLEVHDDYSNEVRRFLTITNEDRNVLTSHSCRGYVQQRWALSSILATL